MRSRAACHAQALRNTARLAAPTRPLLASLPHHRPSFFYPLSTQPPSAPPPRLSTDAVKAAVDRWNDGSNPNGWQQFGRLAVQAALVPGTGAAPGCVAKTVALLVGVVGWWGEAGAGRRNRGALCTLATYDLLVLHPLPHPTPTPTRTHPQPSSSPADVYDDEAGRLRGVTQLKHVYGESWSAFEACAYSVGGWGCAGGRKARQGVCIQRGWGWGLPPAFDVGDVCTPAAPAASPLRLRRSIGCLCLPIANRPAPSPSSYLALRRPAGCFRLTCAAVPPPQSRSC